MSSNVIPLEGRFERVAFQEFSRSIRTGDLDLHIYCLQQITLIFFTFNHQNYSRWLTVYHGKLLKVGLSSSQKNCVICFIESPLKMMKNGFYFILKALFVLKIFKLLS